MQAITNIFEPVNTDNYILASISGIIALGSIIALVVYNLKPNKNKTQSQKDSSNKPDRFKPLASLGFFFLFLISISTAFFSWLTTTKVTTVTINDQYIETPYGKVNWRNVQSINVNEDKQIAPFSGEKVGEATKILVIIEVDGKTHALSEENYDIKEMGKTIKAIRNKNKK